MRTLWDIAVNDLRVFFRERDVWINILVLPVILSFVIGFANGAGQQQSSGQPEAPDVLIDVMDADNSSASADFITRLREANVNFVLCPMDNDADDRCALEGAALDSALAEQRLKDQISLTLVEIPAGFAQALEAGGDASITYRSNENTSAPSFILQAVESTAQRVSAAYVAERIGGEAALSAEGLSLDETGEAALREEIRVRAETLLDAQPPVVSTVISGTTEVQRPGSGGFNQSIPGMATMYVMFAVFPAAVALMTERKQWTLQRLVTLPVARWQILGGKLFARFLLGMLQYAIVFGVGYFLFPIVGQIIFGAPSPISFGSDPIGIVLTMMAFTLCVTAFTLLLTTFLNNVNQASALTLLLTLTLAPLGGAWWPLELVPDWMRTVGYLSPVSWAMNSYTDLIFYNGSLMTILPYIGVLAAMTVVFFLLGVRRFRYET